MGKNIEHRFLQFRKTLFQLVSNKFLNFFNFFSHQATAFFLLNDAERAVFYSSWLYPAIHLFLGVKKEGVTIEEISARFDFNRAKITDILNFFLRTGLATEKKGLFQPGVQSTFVEQGSPYLTKHHSNWRIKAIQKIENLSEQELMFTAPVSISKKDFSRIREKMAHFIKEISEIVKDSEAEEIAHLNLDWFWIGK